MKKVFNFSRLVYFFILLGEKSFGKLNIFHATFVRCTDYYRGIIDLLIIITQYCVAFSIIHDFLLSFVN